MFTVYALHSKKFDKIYVGFTSNLDVRIHFHNELSNKGWTSHFRPWRVIYSEICSTKSDAMIREKQLKSAKGRDFIRSRISTD
jgi:putative endonuclease